MTVSKRRILMNAFFRSQFSYCPLVWMCHSRTLNNKINRLHERCLRIVYNDKLSSFQNLLDQDRSVSVHTRNLQTLAIEMYKVSKGIAPKIFADIFSCNSRANYDLRYQSEFSRPLVKSVFNGTETISNLGPTIWDLVPLEMKQKESLTAFKKAIKTWNPHNCPCILCKKCVFGIGFIWDIISQVCLMSSRKHLTLRARLIWKPVSWLLIQVDRFHVVRISQWEVFPNRL